MPIWDSPLTPKEYWAKQNYLRRWIPVVCWFDDRGFTRIAEFIRKRTIQNPDKVPYG